MKQMTLDTISITQYLARLPNVVHHLDCTDIRIDAFYSFVSYQDVTIWSEVTSAALDTRREPTRTLYK
jgi:hypothetical protein